MIFFFHYGFRRFSSKLVCLILQWKTDLTSLNWINWENWPREEVWNRKEKRKKCAFVKINSKYTVFKINRLIDLAKLKKKVKVKERKFEFRKCWWNEFAWYSKFQAEMRNQVLNSNNWNVYGIGNSFRVTKWYRKLFRMLFLCPNDFQNLRSLHYNIPRFSIALLNF